MNLENPLITPSDRPQTARWRWWVALFVMVGVPLLASVASMRRIQGSDYQSRDHALLPSNVPGLLIYCGFQLGVFALLWAVFWAFSRADQDGLFLRYRGLKSLAWGVAYSLLMRLSIGFVAVFGLSLLAILGFDTAKMLATMQKTGEVMKDVLAPAFASRDPLFRFLLITLISFVVAGLREELWRAATLACLRRLAPDKWSQTRKNAVALGLSSVFFGLGHLYQGIAGVVGTTFLGLILGAIMLRHRSVYPAIVAHGCFNAVSFAALAAMTNGK